MSSTEWQEHVEGYLRVKGRVSLREYCLEKGLKFETLKYHLYRAKHRDRQETPGTFIKASIVEGDLGSLSSAEQGEELRLNFGGTMDLYIPKRFDTETLHRVMRVLHAF